MVTQKISVIIPTFNRKILLLRAINSVINQSMKPFEIIIVDDNSNFDVKSYIYDNIKTTVTIKIIINDTNKGGAQSRNIGVNNAKGNYIAFLDSDDYWSDRKIESVINFLNRNEADLIYSDQWVVDKNGNKHISHKKMINSNLWENLLNGWTAPNTSTLIFKRESFLALKGFDSNLSSCQDHDLWMRIAQNKLNVKFVNERLSYFTDNDDIRISYTLNKRLPGGLTFLKKWEKHINNSKGPIFFWLFKSNYIVLLVYPLIGQLIKKNKYMLSIHLFIRYLSLNPAFYKKVILKSYRTLFHKNR